MGCNSHLQRFMDLLDQGVRSTISPHNRKAWRLLDHKVKLKNRHSENMLEVLIDPQTCGPLLVACEPKAAQILLETDKWSEVGSAIRSESID